MSITDSIRRWVDRRKSDIFLRGEFERFGRPAERNAVRPNGDALLTRSEVSDGDDSALGQFLGFLARDIACHPERLQAVGVGFVQCLQSLTGSIEVDVDAALPTDDK